MEARHQHYAGSRFLRSLVWVWLFLLLASPGNAFALLMAPHLDAIALPSMDAATDPIPPAGNWSEADKHRELTFDAVTSVDWAQTYSFNCGCVPFTVTIPGHGTIHGVESGTELNLILGAHPSVIQINLYFATVLVGHYLIARALSPKWRHVWQYTGIGIELFVDGHNYAAGVRIPL